MKTTREKFILMLGGALLLAFMLAAYSNHFGNGFHMDDGHTIVSNTAIRELGNIPRFFRDATTFSALPSNQSYRPLASTLLAIDYRLGHGLNPFWFHVSIFALFSSLTLLLAFVIYHLLARERTSSAKRWIALAAAAFFALSPANADAINYIIVSSAVMATLGVIASFAFYFAFPQLRRYFLFILPAAIAILAKPTAAIFPVLFLAFRLCFPEKRSKSSRRGTRLLEIVPPFLICAAILMFVERMTPRSWAAGATSANNYLITQPYVALLYFKTFFWPSGLSADYDLHPFVSLGDSRFWMGCAFIVLLSAGAIMAAGFKQTRLIGFGLLWFLIALLPTSLFPLAEVMNDYRAFLPNIGLAIAIAGTAALFLARIERERSWIKIAATSAVVLLLVANAWATFQRNRVWKTEETLWHDVVLKNPRNGRGLMTYGITLVNNGKFAAAIDYLRRAQAFTPPYSVLTINLAVAEDATGQSAAAEQHFKDALRLAPLAPDSYIYYGRYLLAHSRPDEARTLLERLLELTPNDVTARQLLQETETRGAQTETVAADTLLREGRIGEAIAHYDAALKVAPDSTPTLNNLAWALSTAPDASLRDGAKALELAKKADQLGGGENAIFVRTVAAAYAENARFDEAMATAQRAVQLALAQKNLGLAKRLEKDIERYRRNLPLHRVVGTNTPE